MPDDEHSIANGATNSKTCQNRCLNMNKFTTCYILAIKLKNDAEKKIINTIVKHWYVYHIFSASVFKYVKWCYCSIFNTNHQTANESTFWGLR